MAYCQADDKPSLERTMSLFIEIHTLHMASMSYNPPHIIDLKNIYFGVVYASFHSKDMHTFWEINHSESEEPYLQNVIGIKTDGQLHKNSTF